MELQRLIDAQADKLVREVHILDVTLERHSPIEKAEEAALLTAQAKRVRTVTNSLIRSLAQLRDDQVL